MDEKFEMKLEESCLPLIGSGEYIMKAQVDGDILGKSDWVEEHFYIDGPRFRLGEGEIVSVYPGSGMRGSFGDSFAHVIFGRRTLPWERSIEPEKKGRFYAKQEEAPSREPSWLTVLLLRDEEIVNPASGTVESVIKRATDTFVPQLSLEEAEKAEECSYIDLPREFFLELVPSVRELALLSHARRVEPEGKVNNAVSGEEWVSAVVGNRLPASGTEGVRNRAYLVSLEGYGDCWETLKNAKHEKVRLLVLHSWEFYSVTEPLHFLELCGKLDMNRFCVRPEAGTEHYREIVENGYLPMVHSFREGSSTVSFYRGPLVPKCIEKSKPQENGSAVWCQDALYRYDPEIGMFDISYAAAWQLGRLLALGNQAAAGQVQKLRSASKRHLQKQQESEMRKNAGIRACTPDGTEADISAGAWLLQILNQEGGNLL